MEQVFGSVKGVYGSYVGCRSWCYARVQVWGMLVLWNLVQWLRACPRHTRVPSLCGGRDTLTVYRYVFGRRFARLCPRLLHQCIAYLHQHTPLRPPPKMVADGLPRG